jgi:S-adenosylmethionine hydrolase
MYRYITFLTDFGLDDDFVGVCHGVMMRIAPDAQVIDVTHGIAPQAVTQGAIVLAHALPYLPVGVHLAVVDPGVGGHRRGVALRTNGDRVLVGPDNGLLSLAARPGEIVEARSLTNSRYHLDEVSHTFHARDVFAPVAAHVATGIDFATLGDEVDPESLVRIELPEPEVGSRQLRATIVAVDRFGNLQLNLRREHIEAVGLQPGERVELVFPLEAYFAVVAQTFADAPPGELILYEDAYGAYSIAISSGHARELTAARPGDEVRIARARE